LVAFRLDPAADFVPLFAPVFPAFLRVFFADLADMVPPRFGADLVVDRLLKFLSCWVRVVAASSLDRTSGPPLQVALPGADIQVVQHSWGLVPVDFYYWSDLENVDYTEFLSPASTLRPTAGGF
jgi:hypothetical protein